jgi:hypothetical protein
LTPATLHLCLILMYLWLGGWAWLAYRKARSGGQRILFLSIVCVAALTLGTVALAWAQPDHAAVLHHPVGTVLGSLSGALFVFGLFVQERATRQKTPTPQAPTPRAVAIRVLVIWLGTFFVYFILSGWFVFTGAGLLIFACTMSLPTILGLVMIWLRWRREKAGAALGETLGS